MKQRLWLTTFRWICVLPAVCLSFLVSILLSMRINALIYPLFLRYGPNLPGQGEYHFELVWDGPLAAIFFILAGVLVAPSHRTVVALALFGVGAFLTPGCVEQWNIPAYHVYPDTARLCMDWTIASTYIAGALAVACVFFATRRSAAQSA